MKDVSAEVQSWLEEGRQVAMATVIDTWGSSPRAVGANMAVDGRGNIVGSVSGGCVEGAVVELSQTILKEDSPQKVHFGVSDETAWEVGLACGGEIDVFVEKLSADHFNFAKEAFDDEIPAASLTVIEGPEGWIGRKLSARGNRGEQLLGSWDDQDMEEQAVRALQQAIKTGRSGQFTLELSDSAKTSMLVFVEVVPPPPGLYIVGGVHIAVALAEYAKVLGHRTFVVDPRRAFGSAERFPDVDQLITQWPQEAFEDLQLNTSSAVAVLTHDPKIDDPALMAALPSPAYYVGALGSRRTHEKRLGRLRQAGLSEELLERLHAPIGLDIGAKTPEEIALSIMAEIIAARRQG